MSFHFVLLFSFTLIVSTISNNVQLLGLFPKQIDVTEENSSNINSFPWSKDCQIMFHAAIALANQERITVNGQSISSVILETTNEGNELCVLENVCRQITVHRSSIYGIVGPATSNSVRYLSPFAAHLGLPIISYAATNPELSDTQFYPTFYRMVPSDLILVRAIVELFEFFQWKTCTMIIQKDDYGYGGLRLMSENYHTQIHVYEHLTFDVHQEYFYPNLQMTLEKSRSRIVLVWADDQAATMIVKNALQYGLIGGSYVWIFTNKINIQSLQFSTDQWKYLVGLLVVQPIDGLDSSADIDHRLLEKALAFWSHHSSSESIRHNHYNVSSYALYTFDATWTLILALNKTTDFPKFHTDSYCFNASLQNKAEYHKHLSDTKFSGVSGPVEFSDDMSNDRVYGALFVLENLQILNGDLNFKRVMKWFQSNESRWINLTDPVKFSLVWPNGRKKPPSDTPELNGQIIKIRVIESPPFVKIINRSSLSSLPLSQTRLPTNNASLLIEGYVADLIALLRKKMNFTPVIDIASAETAYDQLVDSVLPGNNSYSWDIIISDITITSKRLLNVAFSQTILENNVRIIIRDNQSFQFDFFLFIKPFSWQVWLGILCMIIYSGILLYIFERGSRNEEHFHAKSISIGVFQAISRLVGMSGDITPTTASSRILSIGLGALCIILVATYTANFCSVLTLERTQPLISGIDDIKKGRFEFDRIGIVVNSAIEDYYKDDVSLSYHALQSPQDIYTHLLNEQIDAALWDSATLEYQIYENYCKKLTVVGFAFAKSAFGIAMKPDWLYKTNFDVSIVELREEKELEKLENKWFKKNSCSRSFNDIDSDTSSNSLSIEVMAGLFICFFGLSLITLVIHFWYCRMTILSNIRMIWDKMINRYAKNCDRPLKK